MIESLSSLNTVFYTVTVFQSVGKTKGTFRRAVVCRDLPGNKSFFFFSCLLMIHIRANGKLLNRP